MNAKIAVSFIVASFLSFFSYADIDVYKMKMSLKIPRVYDNTESMGYRKYQTQSINGDMYVKFNSDRTQTFAFSNFVNKTHKMSGKNITYDVAVSPEITPRLNCIGNNKTLKFNTSTFICFMNLNPSYAIWPEPDEDNSMYILLSGTGTLSRGIKAKSISGKVAGQLGCGCTAYGHMSPTRVLGVYGPFLDAIDDIAAVIGTWSAKYEKTIRTEDVPPSGYAKNEWTNDPNLGLALATDLECGRLDAPCVIYFHGASCSRCAKFDKNIVNTQAFKDYQTISGYYWLSVISTSPTYNDIENICRKNFDSSTKWPNLVLVNTYPDKTFKYELKKYNEFYTMTSVEDFIGLIDDFFK